MKMKCFLTAALLTLAMSVSAQVQVFRTSLGHGAICREKKLFFMEGGDECPTWNIVNYKKTGNKETFTLTPKEDAYVTYTCVMLLNGNVPTEMTLTSKQEGKKNLKMTLLTDDEHLNGYYGGLCGYTQTPSVKSGVPTSGNVKDASTKSASDKVEGTAKKAFGKVKGLFKKKDKK